MNVNPLTCDLDRIELFLERQLGDADLSAFESHLSGCDDCRRRLETAVASEDIWSEMRASLQNEQLPPDSPRSGDSESTGEDASSSQTTVLNLLGPTDDDRMLGRWGGYEVVGVVGSGGMGVVLKALDAALNRYVAIKILAPHLGSSGAAIKRFSREGKAAAAVVHDNVIEIYGVAEAAGLPYLVMPYVRGPSLQRRLDDEGSLAVVEILRVGMQAAAGLAAAHAQGLVHRDVKPANILLADGIERVKLTDFGLARAADDASLTRTGIIAGTPQYMSPEQARGEPVDQRSDLFSLGSVLYAMCTGRPPFRAETSYGVLRRITDEESRPIREINPEIPEWLCGIVARLMAKRPEDRFQSAREVAALLEQCLAHVQQPTAVPLPDVLISLRRDECITAERDEYDGGQRSKAKPRKTLLKGTLAMLTLIGICLFAVGVINSPPSDISGNWQGEDWGQVTLTQTAPGEYTGTYTDTVAKEKLPGKIDLKWSRIERRYNGTWREGEDDRFGDLSIRLVGKEIHGGLTTSAESKINPATPRLADLAWTRTETKTGATVPHSHALHFDQKHYAVVPPSAKFTSGDFTMSLWLKPASNLRRSAVQSEIVVARNFGYRNRRGDIVLAINRLSGQLDFTAYGKIDNRSDWIFGWDQSERFRSPVNYDRWNHVAVARRGDKYTMWVNGARACSERSSADISDVDNTNPFNIGTGSGAPPYDLDQSYLGDIDDFRVFRRCLSDEELADLYKSNGDATFLRGEGRVKLGPLVKSHLRGPTEADGLAPLPTWPSGNAPHTHALQFDGNGGTYVDVANPTGLPTGMSARTLAAWFKLASADEDRAPDVAGYGPNSRRAGIPLGLYEYQKEIVGYGPNAEGRRFGIMLDGDRIRAEACVPDAAGRWTPDTNWHHVAAVVPERCTHINQILVYLDGARLATTNHIIISTGPATTARRVTTDGSGRFDTASDPLKIGGIPTVDYAYAFNGSLSEVRIYDRSLSPAEIAVLHGDPQRATNRGLVAGYHLDEGRGSTVHDFSGHGNYGKLHGGVTWVSGRGMKLGPLVARWGEETPGDAESSSRKERGPQSVPPSEGSSQRIATLGELVRAVAADYELGHGNFSDIYDAQDKLLDAQLEAAKSKAERTAVWEKLLQARKVMEKKAEANLRSGTELGSRANYRWARAERQRAELGLAEEKARGNSVPKENASAPKKVNFTIGPKAFATGDEIVVQDVWSELGTLAKGDTVTVKGTCTLRSQAAATLWFYITTDAADAVPGPQPETAVSKEIAAGTASFELKRPIDCKGHLHLGLYDHQSGKCVGTIYFGTEAQMKEISHWKLTAGADSGDKR